MKFRSILAVLIVAMFVSMAAIPVMTLSDEDSSGASVITKVDTDAVGNDISDISADGGLITVGAGALRWVSYVGMLHAVVCVDYGDINSASLNGKAYRTLFDLGDVIKVDSAGIVAKYGSQPNNPPLESDLNEFGLAIHTHNDFTTSDLEAIGQWSNIPKTMVVVKTIYDEFTPELVEGIQLLGIKLVVIRDCVNFLNDDLTIHEDFVANLSIMGSAFDRIDVANELVDGINGHVVTIKGLIDGKKSKFGSAYIGAASNAGAKSLTWTVGDYLPFKLAGVKNAYSGSSTQSVDAGSEVMSSTNPDVIFMDLSGTTKFTGGDEGSNSVLKYAEIGNVPIYTILPYFWFGYNFDNAIANAYYLVYACYDDVITYDETVRYIGSVYSTFYPELKGQTMTIGDSTYTAGEMIMPHMMSDYYSQKGSKLTVDGNCLKVTVGDGSNTFEITDRPDGGDSGGNGSNDNSMMIISIAIIVLVVLGILGYALSKRR